MKKYLEVSQQKFDAETNKTTCVVTRYDVNEDGTIHVLDRQAGKDVTGQDAPAICGELVAPGNPDNLEVIFANETTVGDLPL